jgi:hypothetical protein
MRFWKKIYRNLFVNQPSIDWIEYRQLIQGLNQSVLNKDVVEIEAALKDVTARLEKISKDLERNYMRYILNEAVQLETVEKLNNTRGELNKMMQEIHVLIVDRRRKPE